MFSVFKLSCLQVHEGRLGAYSSRGSAANERLSTADSLQVGLTLVDCTVVLESVYLQTISGWRPSI